jgi:chitin disaccharide deacetylase
MTGRAVIVNADDFGRSPGINRGVATAHEHGIVTSASLMVRWPAAVNACAYAAQHPELSLGIHVDLAEWVYVDGEWVAAYVVVDDDPHAVGAELDRQLAQFRRLTGHDPTHIDSHQHVHRSPEVGAVFLERARLLGVPLRENTPGVAYCGDFFGQTRTGEPYPSGITVEALIAILDGVSKGITEIACHPGVDTDFDSPYQAERALEVETLCHARVRACIASAGIQLKSFSDIPPGTVWSDGA